MARVLKRSDQDTLMLQSGWQLVTVAAGTYATPADLSTVDGWIPAIVPGTVALARQQAGLWTPENPAPLHDCDHWFSLHIDVIGKRVLRFAGLATHAEVWLNGELILRSENMFHEHEVDVELTGNTQLHLCFRALSTLLAKPAKRARWRPTMISPVTLRSVRTTLLGHMPGWCPAFHAVGPWRSISLITSSELDVDLVAIKARLLDEHTGELEFSFRVGAAIQREAILNCGGQRFSLKLDGDSICGTVVVPNIQPWWPHTHGQSTLYPLSLTIGEVEFDLGKVGFRNVTVDKGSSDQGLGGTAFAIKVNGVSVFCRGACWTSADLVGLSGSRETYSTWLTQMRDANMNMVRVGGTMLYEDDAFYELCDELGIMVWQDFMFANFDYPIASESFEHSVKLEVTQFLERTQRSPCLTVLCGGSEVAQQAAMLGLDADAWASSLFTDLLPTLSSAIRPDVPYVVNSPWGGELPFIANAGVTHYYGVGAYQRPLSDVRRTNVAFASECLAFSNVPELHTLHHHLPVAAVHHPQWKQRVPRDQGASWDFEDIRDFYLQHMFAVDPAKLRRTDVDRYLRLSQVVTAEVMEAVFAEWRSATSRCGGGLVWTLQDLLPGAGWGIVDSTGRPKAPWYALKRVFRSVQVVLTDEGVNGLAVHVINDTQQSRDCIVTLQALRGSAVVVSAQRSINIDPRRTIAFSSAEILGRFFDWNYSYRFGPPAHEVTLVTLVDAATGVQQAEAYHFPHGYNIEPRALNWQVTPVLENNEWWLSVQCDQFATAVHISDEGFQAEDNYFHLPPNTERKVKLVARGDAKLTPDGEVTALNADSPVRYRSVV